MLRVDEIVFLTSTAIVLLVFLAVLYRDRHKIRRYHESAMAFHFASAVLLTIAVLVSVLIKFDLFHGQRCTTVIVWLYSLPLFLYHMLTNDVVWYNSYTFHRLYNQWMQTDTAIVENSNVYVPRDTTDIDENMAIQQQQQEVDNDNGDTESVLVAKFASIFEHGTEIYETENGMNNTDNESLINLPWISPWSSTMIVGAIRPRLFIILGASAAFLAWGIVFDIGDDPELVTGINGTERECVFSTRLSIARIVLVGLVLFIRVCMTIPYRPTRAASNIAYSSFNTQSYLSLRSVYLWVVLVSFFIQIIFFSSRDTAGDNHVMYTEPIVLNVVTSFVLVLTWIWQLYILFFIPTSHPVSTCGVYRPDKIFRAALLMQNKSVHAGPTSLSNTNSPSCDLADTRFSLHDENSDDNDNQVVASTEPWIADFTDKHTDTVTVTDLPPSLPLPLCTNPFETLDVDNTVSEDVIDANSELVSTSTLNVPEMYRPLEWTPLDADIEYCELFIRTAANMDSDDKVMYTFDTAKFFAYCTEHRYIPDMIFVHRSLFLVRILSGVDPNFTVVDEFHKIDVAHLSAVMYDVVNHFADWYCNTDAEKHVCTRYGINVLVDEWLAKITDAIETKPDITRVDKLVNVHDAMVADLHRIPTLVYDILVNSAPVPGGEMYFLNTHDSEFDKSR